MPAIVRYVRLDRLMAALRQRTDAEYDAERFIDAYGNFIQHHLGADGSPDAYREWVRHSLDVAAGEESEQDDWAVECRLQQDCRLIDDVARHGVKRPITMMRDEFGVNIDGWHRVVIAWLSGFSAVSFRLGYGMTEIPPEIKGSSRS